MIRAALVVALLVLGLAAASLAVAAGPVAVAAAHPEPGDVDGDGVPDVRDNCVDVRNGNQSDVDGDGRGDACDEDMDNDQVPNAQDNCPPIANDQSTNPCAEDHDADGIPTYRDNCFTVPNADQRDNDRDGAGDACDPDDDDDGKFDDRDNCPLVYNWEQIDNDRDGLGSVCDADDTPGPSSGGGGPGGSGGPQDTSPPRLALTVARRHKLAAVEGGLIVRLRCSEACAATVTLVADRHLARSLRLSRAGVAARAAAQVESEATTYAFVRFPHAVKKRIWRRRATPLTLRVQAVDRAGNRAEAVRKVTLAR